MLETKKNHGSLAGICSSPMCGVTWIKVTTITVGCLFVASGFLFFRESILVNLPRNYRLGAYQNQYTDVYHCPPAQHAKTQEALKKHHLHFPDHNTPYNLVSDAPTDRSQFQEGEYIVDFFFPGKTDGFFIEAGAFDGEHFSQTLMLELKHHWTGLLVEPHPDNFPNLKSKNRKSVLLEGALGNECGIGRLSMEGGAMGGKTVQATGGNVRSFNLKDVLTAMGVKHVDWMVLDLEGFERYALEGFPWDSVTVDLIQLEIFNQDMTLHMENAKFFQEFLEERGFEEQTSPYIDVLFRRKKSNLPSTTAGHMYTRELRIKAIDETRFQTELGLN
eukprot:GHVQ01022644.1.p1 GENE.GHVQ01022644.1~~GHVQ01022644.1.p1  ORF type:complete len:332 (-),score=33.54 GHVQ01022644.1:890-1885(-)